MNLAISFVRFFLLANFRSMAAENFSSTSSRLNSAIDDGSSPFFLHHSDSPGLSLVSQSLTGDNYASWSQSMMIALSIKNKLGFIDGTIQRLSGDVSLLNA